MACNCNTPTFVVQTGQSISPSLESGSVVSIVEEQAQYAIEIDIGCCCGEDTGIIVSTGFIHDGTYYHDGTKFYA